MRIGVDIDDTIVKTFESMKKYEEIYLKEVNLTIDELWSNLENKEAFYRKYAADIYENAKLIEEAKTYINKLSENNEIIFITARNNKYSDYAEDITRKMLDENFKYNEVYFCGKDKSPKAKELNIDIMIDNDIRVYNSFKDKGILVYLYDIENKSDVENKVTSWEEFYNIINNKFDK